MTDLDMTGLAGEWLKQSPIGIMAVDGEGRIGWLNAACATLLDLPGENLLGKTLDDMPSEGHKEIFGDAPLVHLTGPGGERWLQNSVREAPGPAGSLQLHYLIDASEPRALLLENEQLKKQVQELTLTDELTGLANQRALSQTLATQVTRSRRYNNPLSVAVVEIDADGGHMLDEAFDELVLSVSRFLRDRLRWVDFISRYDANRFIVVLPETGEEEARSLFEAISTESTGITLPEALAGNPPRLRVGVAQWEKGFDPRVLVERASEDMHASTA